MSEELRPSRRAGRFVSCGAGVLVALVIARWTYAEPLFGPGRLRFGLELSGESRDNLYLSSGAPAGAFLTTIAPSLHVRFAGGRHYLVEARYRAAYRDSTLEPSRNTALNHETFVGAVYRTPQGFTVAVSDAYRRATDPSFQELVENIPHTVQRARLEVAYREQQRVGFMLRYERVSHRYDDPLYRGALTRYEQRVSLSGDIRFSPKTAVRIGVDAGNTDYEDESNPRNGGILDRSLGLIGMLTPKTTGQIIFGYVTRGFSVLDQPSYSAITARLLSETAFSRRTALRLEAGQEVNDSIYGTNRVYTATHGAVVLTQWIGAAIRVELDGSLARHAYPRDPGTPQRSDTLYRWGTSCALIAARDLELRVFSALVSRDSTVPVYCYADTRTGVSLVWGR